MFGDSAKVYEFDYISPVTEDREANNAERDSQTKAIATLKGAGVKIDGEVLSWAGLPTTWEIEEPEPPAPPPAEGADDMVPARDVVNLLRLVEARVRDDDRPGRGFRNYWH
jgi:hypothetical protein